MNPHQRFLQAKVKNRNEPKQVMTKSEDLAIGKSSEINLIWKFLIRNFQLSFEKTCTYITFKSVVKHRQLSNGYLIYTDCKFSSS